MDAAEPRNGSEGPDKGSKLHEHPGGDAPATSRSMSRRGTWCGIAPGARYWRGRQEGTPDELTNANGSVREAKAGGVRAHAVALVN